MLRLRVLAIGLLPFLGSAPVIAEAVTPEAAAAPAATSTPASSTPTTDAKPQTTAAADPVAPAAAGEPAKVDGTAVAPAAAAPEVKAEVKKPAPVAIPATMTVQIDLSSQRMTVSEHGVAKYTWPISSGTSEFPTPRGTFRPQWTAKMWYSRKYDNAPMPNAVFIHGGVAIHATSHTRALGSPASHGCIRLAPTHAATFYRLVHQHGLKATKVSVYGTPKWRAPAIAQRKTQQARRYAAYQEQNNGFFGFWGSGSSYSATSAYNPGFVKRKVRKQPRVVAYGNNRPGRIAYRRYDGSRVYYVQRPPRKVYYNNSGYGYGSGW